MSSTNAFERSKLGQKNMADECSESKILTSDSKRREEALKYNNQGHKKYLEVDFDDAIADYTRAIELDPELAVAYYNRGTVHYRLGSFDLALKDLKKSVDLEPANGYFAEGLTECMKMCQ